MHEKKGLAAAPACEGARLSRAAHYRPGPDWRKGERMGRSWSWSTQRWASGPAGVRGRLLP